MTKAAEQNYLNLTGEAGRVHSGGKPFSDENCGLNLAAIGTLMALLPKPPARILDMGCGAGWTSIFFAKRGYEVVGQDISQDMLDLATDTAARQGIGSKLSFVRSDYESTDHDQSFDAVVFYDCLHHADDERAALASAYRALKPGGVCITHEPGEGHAETPASIEAMRIYGVSERDMPPHLIIRHARQLGFKSHRIYPMQHEIFDLFYGAPVPPRFSKERKIHVERVTQAALNPTDRGSGIVVLTK